MKERKPWMYKGIDIYPADRNSSGIRWYAPRIQSEYVPRLLADTKQSMRQLINEVKHG